ncbi:MAG: hypothetical protein PHU81_01230 [Acidobacteriota bacterium]|nr:hypothetical protein [Acidobacteriota bacterium]
MINYILVYKIRKLVKEILKEKIDEGEIATTPRSCLSCLADELSWEVYYLFKEMEQKKKTGKRPGKDAKSIPEDKLDEDETFEIDYKVREKSEAGSETGKEAENKQPEKTTDKK